MIKIIEKRRRVKSRKKLTHEEALERISHLAMELQAEKEMYIALRQPLDSSMNLIFTMTGIDDLEKAKKQNEENIDWILWKINEDFGRYVKPGTHRLSAYPYTFTKADKNKKQSKGQMDISDFLEV